MPTSNFAATLAEGTVLLQLAFTPLAVGVALATTWEGVQVDFVVVLLVVVFVVEEWDVLVVIEEWLVEEEVDEWVVEEEE